jgi:hydrogenase nickel incorporation protein HypA/HybF
MHELGITRNIVAIVSEHAGGRAVKSVTLEIGALSAILPEAIRFCFDVVAKDTSLDGAQLDIVLVAARGRCKACGCEFAQATLFAPCPCGSRDVDRLTGEELNIKSYEFEMNGHAVRASAARVRAGQ